MMQNSNRSPLLLGQQGQVSIGLLKTQLNGRDSPLRSETYQSDSGKQSGLTENGRKIISKRTGIVSGPSANLTSIWLRAGIVWVKDKIFHRVTRRKRTTHQEKINICIVVAISHNAKSDLCYLESNWRPQDLINVLRDSLLSSIRWDPKVRICRLFLLDNDERHHN
jgi:hypothetical protein